VAGHVGYGPWRALEVNDQFEVAGRGADYSIAARLRRVRATAAKWASLLPGRKFHVYLMRSIVIVRRVQ